MSIKKFTDDELAWVEVFFREKLEEYEKDLPNAKPDTIYQKCLLDGIRNFKSIVKKVTSR